MTPEGCKKAKYENGSITCAPSSGALMRDDRQFISTALLSVANRCEKDLARSERKSRIGEDLAAGIGVKIRRLRKLAKEIIR